MRFYHHVSIEQLIESGKISEEEIRKAIESGRITLIREEATGKDWIDGAALHKLFGIDHFSHL